MESKWVLCLFRAVASAHILHTQSHVVIYSFAWHGHVNARSFLLLTLCWLLTKFQNAYSIHTLSRTSRTEIGVCWIPNRWEEKKVNEIEKNCYEKFSIEFRSCTNFMLAHIKHNWIWIDCLEWQWVSYWWRVCVSESKKWKKQLCHLPLRIWRKNDSSWEKKIII